MAEFRRAEIVGVTFETTARYRAVEPISMGASGLVCSARDSILQKPVAIKKITSPFEGPAVAKQALREIKLLKHLRHGNVIGLYDIFVSPREDVYLVTDLLSTDLQKLLSVGPLENDYAQYILYQILRGLKYVHSANVIHRDLKPSNILIDQNCDVKICDFGLARNQEPQMTGYVSTRNYRAPEIMLTWQKYDTKVDIWSAACIFAEMLQGKPLFPGRNHVEQFQMITDILGHPPEDMIVAIVSKQTLEFVRSLPKRERKPFSEMFSGFHPAAIALLEIMLLFDPQRRASACSALAHPYLAPYHDPTDEPVAQDIFDWFSDNSQLSVDIWRTKIYAEIICYRTQDAQSTERAQVNETADSGNAWSEDSP